MGRTTSDKALKRAFGRRLRSIRNRRSLTQQGLAVRAHITLSYVFRLEKGERNPTLLILHDLARALHVHPEDLVATRKGA